MNAPKPPLRKDVLVIFAGTFAVALTLVPVYGWLADYSIWSWALFAVFLLWNGLSITAGYHRLWAHKSYQANTAVRLAFALGGALALQNSIKEWCSGHRQHHRYVDDNIKDPYSAGRGLWYSHIGWMLRDHGEGTDYRNIRDLERDWIVNWQFKYYWFLSFGTNVCLPMSLGALWGDPFGALLLAGFLRLVICHHTTFFINSLAHYWGKQPYSDENSAKDNPVIALLTYGEGYHNYHHHFQWDYRNGIRWYDYDPTKWLIRLLSWSGMTWNLKTVEPFKIEISRLAMERKRASMALARSNRFDREKWQQRLELEYAELLDALAEWEQRRQEWLGVRKQLLKQQWAKADVKNRTEELRGQLQDLEVELDLLRKRWRLMTGEFTAFA